MAVRTPNVLFSLVLRIAAVLAGWAAGGVLGQGPAPGELSLLRLLSSLRPVFTVEPGGTYTTKVVAVYNDSDAVGLRID